MDSKNRTGNTVKTKLKLRPCTSFDFEENLFQPYNKKFRDGYLESIKNDMLCLDELSIVELQGQYINDDGGFLRLSVWKCPYWRDGNQCAS